MYICIKILFYKMKIRSKFEFVCFFVLFCFFVTIVAYLSICECRHN